MWNIIIHTFVRATVVSTSGHARMFWLFDVSLFTVLTSRNEKMRRNRSIGTISVLVVIPIIWYVNNKFQILWHVNKRTKNSSYIIYENFITKIHKSIIRQMIIDINNCKLDLACLTKHWHDKYRHDKYISNKILNHVVNQSLDNVTYSRSHT
jgi:hypothetical protein